MCHRIGIVLLLLVGLIGAAGCQTSYPPTSNNGIINGNYPPTGPSPLPAQSDTIEYRVTGTASSVIVRFSNSQDGLTQVTTSLPYVVSFRASSPTLFLSLDVTPIASWSASTPLYPFLAAQIFVNGNLFREASASSLASTIGVSGTYRH